MLSNKKWKTRQTESKTYYEKKQKIKIVWNKDYCWNNYDLHRIPFFMLNTHNKKLNIFVYIIFRVYILYMYLEHDKICMSNNGIGINPLTGKILRYPELLRVNLYSKIDELKENEPYAL